MKEIQLTKGYVALVDDEDFERVNQYCWCAGITTHRDGSKTVYAKRANNEVLAFYCMHRLILGITDPQIEVDHEDHNGLNNQKYNLRVATSSQNQANAKVRSDNTSGFKGVCWHKQHEKWNARIQVNGTMLHLGLFTDPIEAAKSYDAAAVKYHGEFARCNFAEAS
jgi:hypothetical protein